MDQRPEAIDARDFPGRPHQLDDLTAGLKDIADGVSKTNRDINVFKQNTWGLWALVVAIAYGAYKVGVFAEIYNANAVYGSPALLKFQGEVKAEIAGIKKTDDERYGTLNKILVEQQATSQLTREQIALMTKRIERLEDRK